MIDQQLHVRHYISWEKLAFAINLRISDKISYKYSTYPLYSCDVSINVTGLLFRFVPVARGSVTNMVIRLIVCRIDDLASAS